MGKRVGNLLPMVSSFENLLDAFYDASRGKRYRDEVLVFKSDLEANLFALEHEMRSGSYRPRQYREFTVTEPKKRIVMALPFRDRVAQWAIYRVLNPIIDRSLIEDTYACRQNKGAHAALDRLQKWLQHADRASQESGRQWYALKMDIAKYFYRIDHQALNQMLAGVTKDHRLLELLSHIIGHGGPFGIPLDAGHGSPTLHGIGMPIGNLTSQMFANLYLSGLDHHLKDQLGVKYYLRYMDDMIILADSKPYLHQLHAEVETYLAGIGLNLNSKTSIRPVRDGVAFVGYRSWATHRRLRKSTMRQMTRRMTAIGDGLTDGTITDFEEVRPVIASYLGIARHFNSYYYRLKLAEHFPSNQ